MICFFPEELPPIDEPVWQGFHRLLIEPSPAYNDFLLRHHEHDFYFTQGNPFRMGFLWAGCATGGIDRDTSGNQNDLLYLYNQNKRFRKYIKEKIHNGELTRQDMVNVLSPSRLNQNQNSETEGSEKSRISRKLIEQWKLQAELSSERK